MGRRRSRFLGGSLKHRCIFIFEYYRKMACFSSMRQLDNCCCFPVRTGAILIALLNICLNFLTVVASCLGLAILLCDIPSSSHSSNMEIVYENYEDDDHYHEYYDNHPEAKPELWTVSNNNIPLYILLGVSLLFGVTGTVICSLLLVGIKKHRHKLMMPWMILSAFGIAATCIAASMHLFRAIVQPNWMGLLGVGLEFGSIYLSYYFLMVVNSEYQNLKKSADFYASEEDLGGEDNEALEWDEANGTTLLQGSKGSKVSG